MIHLRVDSERGNDKRLFACGIGPELPEGDAYFFEADRGLHYLVTCPACKPAADPLGTPIGQLSGNPGHPGYAEFCRIAGTWGHD